MTLEKPSQNRNDEKKIGEGNTYEQYNSWGAEYIEKEREFYLGKIDPTHDFFTEALKSNIEGKVLVDVGCGAGDELIEYARMGAAKVIGIEPSSIMRDVAQEVAKGQGLPIELMSGEFESLPFDNESVDVVTARYSLHILSKFDKAFEEVARVLKPEGLFLVSVSHPKYDAKLARKQGKSVGERIQIKLFKGGVMVDNGTHTMEEYLEGASAKYFICEDRMEYAMNGIDNAEPTDLILRYKKKLQKNS